LLFLIALHNQQSSLDTYIVIVNYKTADLVMLCLESISKQNNFLGAGKVIVVDNHSEDSSNEKLISFVKEKDWQSWIVILSMPINGGFAYGCNAGIRHVYANQKGAKYIMLLNPDTLVRDGAVVALIDFMETNSKVGIAGSQIENQHGKIESSAHRFHNPIGEMLDGAQLNVLTNLFSSFDVTPQRQSIAHQCDWVSGSCMIIRKNLIDNIGLLDETYFLYFEEVDFFYRAAKAGWQTWYVPSAIVMHIEGASTGIKEKTRRPRYWFESRRRYLVKQHGVLGLIASDLMWGIGRLSHNMRRLLKIGAKNSQPEPKYFTLDLLWGDFKAILTGKVFKLEKEKIRF
jgi:N-acetylglucosaminyl-diphospho-decaprenol L-rhamnosyltransferase